MRYRYLWLLTGVLVGLPFHTAQAGGWWTGVDIGRFLGNGESLDVRISEVLYPSSEEASAAAGSDYFAYLVKDFDQDRLKRAMTRPQPERWWRPLSPPIKVGTVTLSSQDANLLRGHAHIDMPDVPPGGYFLMLCDRGCETPLGNHIPSAVRVVSDPLVAQTARRLTHMNERMSLALARLRSDLRTNSRGLAGASAEASEAMETVAAMRRSTSSEGTRTPSTWVPYAGWLIAGLSLGLIAGRLRQPRPSDLALDHIPDDARELTTTR